MANLYWEGGKNVRHTDRQTNGENENREPTTINFFLNLQNYALLFQEPKSIKEYMAFLDKKVRR